ncbi:hypothetical protein C8R46DRAFT_1234462 [Mycena filopes]|nr:hypothetical protein C8R46DRAFT_1234462 [Mycena filopes]
MSQDLTFASADTFILRADSETVISDSSSVGRNSVRIRTNNAYITHAAVFDIVHIPQGGDWAGQAAIYGASGCPSTSL